MSTTLSFQSIASSNLPTAEKSAMMRAYERISGKDLPANLAAKFGMVKGAGLEGLEIVRAYGEAGITGGVLGLADAHYGLDQHVRGHVVPADLVGAGVAALGAVALGAMGNPLATESRNIGTACTSVFSYRKLKDYQKSASGAKVHGDVEDYSGMSGDPIIDAARSI